jgi:hypothetical protein
MVHLQKICLMVSKAMFIVNALCNEPDDTIMLLMQMMNTNNVPSHAPFREYGLRAQDLLWPQGRENSPVGNM